MFYDMVFQFMKIEFYEKLNFKRNYNFVENFVGFSNNYEFKYIKAISCQIYRRYQPLYN